VTPITEQTLLAYLDDTLGEAESAFVERELRAHETLRERLRQLLAIGDRGEHSVGAVWRRQRLTCPSREQLGSYVLDILEPAQRDYFTFHLETVGCPFCQANLADLQNQERDAAPAQAFRRRVFDSSAGLLKKA
jgi:anti-sigma factor RsiW